MITCTKEKCRTTSRHKCDYPQIVDGTIWIVEDEKGNPIPGKEYGYSEGKWINLRSGETIDDSEYGK